VLTPPVLTDHHIIVRGVDGSITALTTNTGDQAWTFKRDVPALSLRGTSQPIISFGRIYTGLDNGRLVVLDAKDGRTLFDVAVTVPTGRTELERIVDIDGQAVLRDGVLYMASYQGRVVAIDVRRGQLSWARKMSIVSGVELSGSYLFTSDERDHIWALDKNNGATIWKQEKLQAREITLPVAMQEALVVADDQGYLHWLSQYDGHFMARILVDDSGIIVPPVVQGDRVYIQDRDGTVSAFQLVFDN
jgi:outer membrane protein assembly factor BamB